MRSSTSLTLLALSTFARTQDTFTTAYAVIPIAIAGSTTTVTIPIWTGQPSIVATVTVTSGVSPSTPDVGGIVPVTTIIPVESTPAPSPPNTIDALTVISSAFNSGAVIPIIVSGVPTSTFVPPVNTAPIGSSTIITVISGTPVTTVVPITTGVPSTIPTDSSAASSLSSITSSLASDASSTASSISSSLSSGLSTLTATAASTSVPPVPTAASGATELRISGALVGLTVIITVMIAWVLETM